MSDQSRDSSPASARSGSRSVSRSPSRSPSRSRYFSSSSASSSPRFVSATDSDGDKKSGSESPKSPKRKVRTKKSPKQSSADSESEAEEETRGRRPARKAAAKKKTVTKKKEHKEGSEEGELSDSDNEEFNDGYDENLMGDEDDRERLENMNEIEREKELFRRGEEREKAKKRWEIEKKLKQQKRLKGEKTSAAPTLDDFDADELDYSASLDTKERSQTRQKKIEEKKFGQKSSALDELKAKREEKNRKDLERQKKESEKDDDDKKSKSVKRQRSSSSSSSGGSDRSRDRRRSTSSSSRSSSGSGSDTERFKKSPSKVQKYIETQDDLERIRLSRWKIEKFHHAPFFKKLSMNCFVRIGIGQDPKTGRSVYRAAEIVDVVETAKIYSIGKHKTNKGLRLRFGKEERVFRFEFISNQSIQPQEFFKWKEACENAGINLPTLEAVKAKTQDIKKAMNYAYTSDDIEKIVAQKEKFQSHPVNYAMHKARLIKEKEIALARNEDEKAKELENKLNQLEERAEELDKSRTRTISSIGLINDRNRRANVDKAEAAITAEIKRKQTEGVESNPFTRRKCNPRIVTKFTAEKVKGNVDLPKIQGLDQKENVVKIADTTITANKRKPEDAADAGKGDKDKNESTEPKKKKNNFSAGFPASMQKEDLFDAHNFDIEIQMDTNFGANANPGAPSIAAPSLDLKPANPKEGLPGKRSFTIKDYKRGIP